MRVSAWEFAEWQIIFQREQLHPRFQQLRHAQDMAVTLQGPSRRRGGDAWAVADFLQADPWASQAPSSAAVDGAKGISQAERMRRFVVGAKG